MSILAIDYGARYVGLAVTAAGSSIALRHSTLDQKQVDAEQDIGRIVANEQVTIVVLGMPKSLSGAATAQSDITAAFADKLRRSLPARVQLLFADETFTSKEAERRLQAEGGKLEDVHAESARLILENYLAKSK